MIIPCALLDVDEAECQDDGDDDGGLSRKLMALLVEGEMVRTSSRGDRKRRIRGGNNNKAK